MTEWLTLSTFTCSTNTFNKCCMSGMAICCFCLLVKSRLSLCSPHGLQQARLLCLLLSPGVCSNSCPLSPWSHWTISSFIIPFSSCLQSFPASGSFPAIQLQSMGSQRVRHDWAAKQWKWTWQQFMRYTAATTSCEGWPGVYFATAHIVPMRPHLSCLAD